MDELTTKKEEEKREFEEKVQSERDRVQAEEVLALKESIHVDNLVSATIESEAAPPPPPQARGMPESYRLAAPLSEGELASLLLSSPLYQKIEGIKSLLSGGAGKGGANYSAPGKDWDSVIAKLRVIMSGCSMVSRLKINLHVSLKNMKNPRETFRLFQDKTSVFVLLIITKFCIKQKSLKLNFQLYRAPI